MDDNGRNKRIITVLVILTIIFTLFGSTLAYLNWQTSEDQRTLVSLKVLGGSLRIVGDGLESGATEVSNIALRPTNDCDGVASLVGEAVVTAVNETNNSMIAILKLDATLTRTYGSSYDVVINDKTKDAREYLKWAVVETTDTSASDNACDSAIYNGTFEGITSSTGIGTGIKFTVPSDTTVVKKYKMYIWLDETYEYTNTGSEITNPMDNLKVVAKWSTTSILTNAPQSGAQQPEAPVLDDGMIPVTISNNGTVKTISKNDASWYNYSNKEWANVVLVDNDSRSTYLNTSGKTVSEDDILAYYVWIPRYSYRIPKIKCSSVPEADRNMEDYPDCYAPYTISDSDKRIFNAVVLSYMVDVVGISNFTSEQSVALTEKALQTGWYTMELNGLENSMSLLETVNMANTEAGANIIVTPSDFNGNNISKGIGIARTIDITFENTEATMLTGDAVTSYRTHPAFWWDNDSDGIVDSGETVAGIWVGKFETSTNTDSTCYTSNSTANCVATNVSPRIVPNVEPLRHQNVSTQFTTSQKFSASGNIYGLSSTSTNAHMMKNSEWGAVAYLSHSEYGINEEIYINNSSSYYTGRSGGNVGSDSLSSNTYGNYAWLGQRVGTSGTIESFASNRTLGTKASTTGNITGIYDMSGGVYEYVMGVLADDSGNPRSGYNSDYNSGFNGLLSDGTSYTSGINFPVSKYYDLYEYTPIGNLCNGGNCYGHALLETNEWYNDYAYFVASDSPWFQRGGSSYSGAVAGVFHASNDNGSVFNNVSWRSVLVVGFGA